ncbi:hypothetical protein HHK36_002527 [Tetracentron sinense]|uniref:Armadillo repeat-containing protein 6 n=1 Tax=Tetracentron sinense TaxID=13715 RepID=A0A834ZPJ5_TETSI|nr:hypothetical protein HHK36_002527 [Tetracentron sinense]
MGPKGVRVISQEAFDELVRENMEDLGMDPADALQDAIETLTLQGVDFSGIVTCIPGVSSVKDNPVIQSLDRLEEIVSRSKDQGNEAPTSGFGDKDLEEMADLLDTFSDLCCNEGSGNASIATRNGGVELVCSICSKLSLGCELPLASALKTMASFLHDIQSTETFRKSGGPKIVVDILNASRQNFEILNNGFSVVAAAATGNELLKESFMDLKIDELLIQIMREQKKGSIQSLYDAVRVLLTADDNRVLASQVFGYARRFAKMGIAGALVDAVREGLSSPSLISASIALKAVAVNDEICRSIAEDGGIDAVLQCIDDSGTQNNKAVARACCSLLSKLAGSDANKSAIVEKGGMDRLIKLSSKLFDDPSVLQEIMSIICTLSLRSPDNAARAVEAGAGELAIQAMQKFPSAHQMQKQSCLMIRNLVARNQENRQVFATLKPYVNSDFFWLIEIHFEYFHVDHIFLPLLLQICRTLLLNNGIEKIIRKAKENHESCKEAATDALRDLGLDNYNL